MAVKLIVDTGCDLDLGQAKALDVLLIPMTVRFENKEYRSGIDLSHGEFYKKLDESSELPVTSQPAPFAFEAVFHQVKECGDEAVVLCISSALSGTYQSASIAAEGLEDCIHVVDTQAVSIAQRVLLDHALALKKSGLRAAEIAHTLEKRKKDVRAYGVVESLEYLMKGGRLSKTAGTVGSILGIRPVLHLQNGELAVVGKARGAKGAITMTNALIAKEGIDFSMPVGIGYTGNDPHFIDAFLDGLHSPWEGRSVPIYNVGSTVGTHTGPGLFIAAFFKKS